MFRDMTKERMEDEKGGQKNRYRNLKRINKIAKPYKRLQSQGHVKKLPTLKQV